MFRYVPQPEPARGPCTSSSRKERGGGVCICGFVGSDSDEVACFGGTQRNIFRASQITGCARLLFVPPLHIISTTPLQCRPSQVGRTGALLSGTAAQQVLLLRHVASCVSLLPKRQAFRIRPSPSEEKTPCLSRRSQCLLDRLSPRLPSLICRPLCSTGVRHSLSAVPLESTLNSETPVLGTRRRLWRCRYGTGRIIKSALSHPQRNAFQC